MGQPLDSITGMTFPRWLCALSAFRYARPDRADQTVDIGLRDALVAHQLEQARKLARGHVRGHARVLGQDAVEVALARDRLLARLLDDQLRLMRTELGA